MTIVPAPPLSSFSGSRDSFFSGRLSVLFDVEPTDFYVISAAPHSTRRSGTTARRSLGPESTLSSGRGHSQRVSQCIPGVGAGSRTIRTIVMPKLATANRISYFRPTCSNDDASCRLDLRSRFSALSPASFCSASSRTAKKAGEKKTNAALLWRHRFP